MVELSHLAPDALRPACDMLTAGDLREAGAVFRDALRREHSNSVAWLGLVQADPAFRETELTRLGCVRAVDRVGKFRLGVLMLYKWGEKPVAGSARDVINEVKPARKLLEEAWDGGKGETLFGAMYVEPWVQTPQATTEPLRATLPMMANVLPSALWTDYRDRLANARWGGAPPPVDAVPKPLRRVVWAVLGTRWSLLTARIGSVDVTAPGKVTNSKQRKAQAMEADYLQRWFRLLKTGF